MRTSESFTNALQDFVSHLPSCASALERQHAELQEVAGVVDKTHKGVRIAGITGGATGAVGGVAAVAGILLSPVTLERLWPSRRSGSGSRPLAGSPGPRPPSPTKSRKTRSGRRWRRS